MALVQYENEYSRLRKVALYRPSLVEIDQKADVAMYIKRPTPSKVLEEFDSIVTKLQSLNIETIVLENQEGMPRTTNMIFLRDVALVFRDKIILANMKHLVRREEPRKFKELLVDKDSGFNELFIDLDAGSMEGADIFVIANDLMYVYAGNRTSDSTANMLREKFQGLDIRIIQANIHGIPQHILGGVHLLDDKTATRRTRYCTDSINNYKFIDFGESKEVSDGFALNIVTISPREVLMPANNPTTKRTLEARGIICHEVKISEIHKMGGGLACMILPLFRERSNVV